MALSVSLPVQQNTVLAHTQENLILLNRMALLVLMHHHPDCFWVGSDFAFSEVRTYYTYLCLGEAASRLHAPYLALGGLGH